MKQDIEEQVKVPYSKVGKELLQCIFEALLYIFDAKSENTNDDIIETKLKELFKLDSSNGKEDFHLNAKRFSKILLTAYDNVQENSQSSEGCCIPSPLSILYQMLTVPDEPQSAAYGFLFCRSLLYETFHVFPKYPLSLDSYESFNYEKISESLRIFANYTKHDKNISETKSKPVQSMLAHYLALKNIFYMRFKKETDVREYLESKIISANNEFHKYTYYNNLPDASSIINELSGIPIPLKGLDTVFQGGLRTKSNSNLVMRISGQPGSGKTSFALALAASMAPFGTFTCYLSLGEEETADLKNRLTSLVPEYLKELSIYPKQNVDSWFLSNSVPITWDGDKNEDKRTALNNLTQSLDDIFSVLETKLKDTDKSYFPSVCPLIIIIDSIRPFLKEDLNKFVEKCRRLQALIILISPNDEQYHNDIDYMVDTVINLKQVGSDGPEEKPTRIIQLTKTRYQSARHGAHVFHLSGRNGIRVSPQLPSQVDKREIVSNRRPSDTIYTNFFNEYSGNPRKNNNSPCLQIWDKSQILLHGYGSTGKAGLALALLLYPFRKIEGKSPEQEDKEISRKRKILVVSLLYPEEYYNNLEKRIKKSSKDKIQNDAKIECICFYSGHLTSEDFIGKILGKLDTAVLEGEPFTGILLDGLHNATLQFPKLQKSDMVWSTLYSLLTRYYLTIVTTYTNFIVENDKNREDKLMNKEDKFLLKGGEILLDILFQSADYSFTVRKLSDDVEKKRIKEGRYIVTLKSAIKHRFKPKDENFIWDREDLVLEEYLTPSVSNLQQDIFFPQV